MNLPKKRPAAAAGIITAALVLASCGSDDAGTAAVDPEPESGDLSGSITVWHYPVGPSGEETFWDDFNADFAAEHPDVDVEIIIQPFANRAEAITTAIAGNEAPDVIYLNPNQVPQLAEEGVLHAFDTIQEEEDYVDAALEAYEWDGEVYAVPILMQLFHTICNTAVLDEAGVEECPTTWDELEAAAPAIADAGLYPTHYEGALGLTLNQTFYPYLWQAGGEVLNEDKTAAAFNSPEGLRALEFVKMLADNGWVSQQSLTSLEPFEQTPAGLGEAAILPTTQVSSMRNMGLEDDIELLPPFTDQESVAAGSVGGFGIFNTTENLDIAVAWVNYVTSADKTREFLAGGSQYYAPRVSIDNLYDDDSLMAEGEQYLDRVRTGIGHPQEGAIADAVSPYIQSVLINDVDPAEALADAEAEVNALLGN